MTGFIRYSCILNMVCILSRVSNDDISLMTYYDMSYSTICWSRIIYKNSRRVLGVRQTHLQKLKQVIFLRLLLFDAYCTKN